jgi:hypothetical protein
LKDAGKALANGASELQKPAVLTLDVVAISFQGASAVITDVATVAGCIAGIEAGPAGVAAGCAAGYAAGRSATTGYRIIGNVASALSTAIGCASIGQDSSGNKEVSHSSVSEDCGISIGNTVVSAVVQDPNVGLASDVYQFCRDLGECGP